MQENFSRATLKNMSNALRVLSMDMVEEAKSGHPGMPMGFADVMTVLYSKHVKFNAEDPHWRNRDRVILSAGHGSALLYATYYLCGYKDTTLNEIKNFRQLYAKTAGHPEYGYLDAIETTTGPLGQGIANAVGMSLASQIMQTRYGKQLFDHNVYCIVGDGCLMEGISQEAISFAGNLQLDNMILLWDNNSISIDGSTDLAISDDYKAKFESCNWHVIEVDGHDYEDIDRGLSEAKDIPKPVMISCKTIIGHSSPNKAGSAKVHGAPLGKDEIALIKEQINWSQQKFAVPDDILQAWRKLTTRCKRDYDHWSLLDKPDELIRLFEGKLPENFTQKLLDFKKELASNIPKEATRKSSQRCLEFLVKLFPEMLGGSADLTSSNLTQTSTQNAISKDNFVNSYIYYGVREHAMVAVMNGLSLYGTFIPYGGTFMVFSDYCRPAIRLSALMKLRNIYVMTHDSIGLGEDGPTHQPVEHVASLRAIPNLLVMRPANLLETLECWEIALRSNNAPTVLSLTRQSVDVAYDGHDIQVNRVSKGGYIIKDFDSDKKNVVIMATGSEVELAILVRERLSEHGFGVRVVSMPCLEILDQQRQEYIDELLCDVDLKVAIEARNRARLA